MNNMFQDYMSQMFKFAQNPFGMNQTNFNPFGFNPFMNQMNNNPFEQMKQMNEKMMAEQKKFYEKFSNVLPNMFKNDNGEIKPVNEQVTTLLKMFEQVCHMEEQKQMMSQVTEMYKKNLEEQYKILVNLMPKVDENGEIEKVNFEETYKKFKETVSIKDMVNNQVSTVKTLNDQFLDAFKKANPGLEKVEGKVKEFKDKAQSGNLPFGMPVQLIQTLMQLEASPEKLNMLQRVLDFIFDQYEKGTTNKQEEPKENQEDK